MKTRFRGRFEIKLDSKGRLSLPSAVRGALGKGRARLVVTNGRYQNKPCLHAYAAADWAALEKRVAALPSLRPELQAFQRFYMSGAQEIEIDDQGRLSVPQSLRRYAALDSDATLVGLGDKLEIWPAALWNSVCDSLAESFDDVSAAVARLAEGGR